MGFSRVRRETRMEARAAMVALSSIESTIICTHEAAPSTPTSSTRASTTPTCRPTTQSSLSFASASKEALAVKEIAMAQRVYDHLSCHQKLSKMAQKTLRCSPLHLKNLSRTLAQSSTGAWQASPQQPLLTRAAWLGLCRATISSNLPPTRSLPSYVASNLWAKTWIQLKKRA